MNIGLDFDEVIAQTHLLKPFVAQKLYGVEVDPAKFRKGFVVGNGILTKDQYAHVGREVFSGKYPMKEVPGALLHIGLLRHEGHTLRIITNRSEEWTLEPAKKWLEEHDLGDVSITGIVCGTSKAVACGDLSLFVDDDPLKLAELRGVVKHRLLFRWPQNEHEPPPPGTVPIYSWREIYSYIASLEQGGCS